MRLTGKFALVATLVATLAGTIMAAAVPITSITKGTNAGEVIIGGSTFAFTNRDAFVTAVLAGTAGDHEITGTTDTVDAGSITLSDGKVVTFAVTAADPDKKQTITITAGGAAGTAPTDLSIPSTELAYTATELNVSADHLNHIKKLALTAPQITLLKKILADGSVTSFTTPFASVSASRAAAAVNALAVGDDFNVCYTLSDNNSAKICVFHAANDANATVSVTATPTTTAPGVDKEQYIAGVAVFALALTAPIGFAFVHSMIDPQGYQAGKDASLIPSFYKAWLPDTEFASEEGFGMDSDDTETGEIRVDPNTGRPIRVKKSINGGVAGDDTDATDPEATNAYGVSVLAAALMVPFLL